MSYPPQYGQPQQGGYPQGYPQQQGYPHQGYPQQPGGYPPPGYPPQGPKKNTGLIVALAGLATAAIIALVLVIVLQPDDKTTPAADGKPTGGIPEATLPPPNAPKTKSSGTGGSSSGGSAETRALAEKAVDVINSRSTSEIGDYTCDSNATRELTSAMNTLPSSAKATLSAVNESGTYAQGIIKINMGSQTQTVSLEMSKKSSKWCIAGL